MLPEQERTYKLVLYHEAAHAVVLWNFGRQVRLIKVNANALSGDMWPSRAPEGAYTPIRRIEDILVSLAGGMSHVCYPNGQGNFAANFSSPDFVKATALIKSLADLPPGAELYLWAWLNTKTAQLLQTPEVRVQIQTLVKHLRPQGCLLQRQIHCILKAMPEKKRAEQACRQMVANMVAELEDHIAKSKEAAPRIVAMSGYDALQQMPPTTSLPAPTPMEP